MVKQDARAKSARRRYSEAFKRELVQRSLRPGASVSAIALEQGMNANVLFKWRRAHLRGAARGAQRVPGAAVLLMLVPALNALWRVVPARAGVIVLWALVAHTGWHWMAERWAALRQFPMPAQDAAAAAAVLRWLMAAMAAALAVWAADRFVRRWMGAEEAPPG